MYNSWSLEYFTHTIAHATGKATYDLEKVPGPNENGTDQHDALYREMYAVVAKYNQHMNDGWVIYIKFRFTNNNTKETVIYQYDYNDPSRKFRLNNSKCEDNTDQYANHQCTYQETPDGMGCPTCLYS